MTIIIDHGSEECALIQLMSDAGPFKKAENKLSMVVLLTHCSLDDYSVVCVDKRELPFYGEEYDVHEPLEHGSGAL